MLRALVSVLSLTLVFTLGACVEQEAELDDDVPLEERAPEPIAGIEEPVAGTYELVRFAGEPLPVALAPVDECTRSLRAAALTVRGENQAYALDGEVMRECEGEEPETERIQEPGNYILEGSTIHFTDDLDASDALPEPHEGAGIAPEAFTFETFAGDGTIGEGDTLTVLQPGNWEMTFAPVN
jgi:hypothetical protein